MSSGFQKYLAEFFGTAVLVLIGCSSIVLSGGSPASAMGIILIGMTFGMTVTAMAFTIGPVSGCHLNPSVTAAVWAAGRMESRDAIAYIVAQFIGGIIGALVLFIIVKGRVAGFDLGVQGLGQNDWKEFSAVAAILAEIVATLIFTIVILAVTGSKGATPLAGLIIGITLMIMHFAFIRVSGASLNGARSLGPGLFAGEEFLHILMYLIVPTITGALVGWLVRAKLIDV